MMTALLSTLGLVILGGLAFSESTLITTSEDTAIPMKFIYVHGANQNTSASRAIFTDRVERLHAEIGDAFSKNELIQLQFLQDGRYTISPDPVPFFWGDLSQSEIAFLRQDLSLLNGIRTRLAGRARERLAYVLHDAVWFERPKNKYRILKALHETIMEAHGQNRPVMLMGHSAGSLVVFNYLTYLLPVLDTAALLNLTRSPEAVAEVISSSGLPSTCALALLDSGAFRPDLAGQLVSTYENKSGVGVGSLSPESRQLYLSKLPDELRKATQTSCLPTDVVRGMVTFGSPIPIFESDVGRKGEAFSLLVSYMLKYLLENGLIWLHVNHINDPIGFPIPGYEVVDRIEANHGIKIQPRGGMIAGNSNVRGGAYLRNAHGWYWNHPKDFAQAIVKTYEDSQSVWQSRVQRDAG